MSSGWEIASDICGGVSAVLLLIPAFGSNAISKRITKVREGLQKHRVQRGDHAGAGTPVPITGKPFTDDQERIEQAVALAEQLKQRWTPNDERYLRIAAILLVASFALKGIHHIPAAECPANADCEQRTKPVDGQR
jgi:hypothetical protein